MINARPNPKEPLWGGFGGFVAEIQHRNEYYDETAYDGFCHLVVFCDDTNQCPNKYAHCVEVKHTKGDEKGTVYRYTQNVGDDGVECRHYGKDQATLEV